MSAYCCIKLDLFINISQLIIMQNDQFVTSVITIHTAVGTSSPLEQLHSGTCDDALEVLLGKSKKNCIQKLRGETR